MSRTEQTPRAPDSTPDAWQRHDDFHKQLDTPQVQDALATIKAHLHPIFVENAFFCEETGMPTVPLNFLVEILELSGLLPRLTSHNFKLGLQLAISRDLNSPLTDSPSKHYSEQTIQFDTFINAFAFSMFSYPSQSPQLDNDNSAQAQRDPQDANHFATSLTLAAKRLSESAQTPSKAAVSENTSSLKAVSKDLPEASSPKPQSLLEMIDQVNDLQSAKESLLEQHPLSPIIQDDENSLHDASTVREEDIENESNGTFNTEPSAPPTPAHYFTPRAHFAKPTPLKMFKTASFASSPKNFAWFTPRQAVNEGSRASPNSNRFRGLFQTSESKKKQTTVNDSPRLQLSDDSQCEVSSQEEKDETPVPTVQEVDESELTIDVTHSEQEYGVVTGAVQNVQDTTGAPSIATPSQEHLTASPESDLSVENVLQTTSRTDGDMAETPNRNSSDITHLRDDETSSERLSASSNPASPFVQSPASQFQSPQSPEIRDTFAPMEHRSLEDPSSSRKLSFSDSEDGNNSMDESSHYDTDEARSTPEMKISQASSFGQQIEEPEVVSELESLPDNERDEADLHTGDDHPPKISEEGDDQSPLDSPVEKSYHLETGFLSDRSDSAHSTRRAASMGTLFNGGGSLFGDFSPASKSQLQFGRNDFGFDSTGEYEQTELLFQSGSQSDSSELSMHTRETYSRMLDQYIENGNFRSKIDSISIVEEQVITYVEGHDNSENEHAAPIPQEQVFVRSEDIYRICEDSPADMQQFRGPEDVCDENSHREINKEQSYLVSEAEESGKGSDGPSQVSAPAEEEVSCNSFQEPAMSSGTREQAKAEETHFDAQCGNGVSAKSVCLPKGDESYLSPAPLKRKERLTSELTPEDFNVVRKQVNNLPSLEMLVDSSLGSVCTKASHDLGRFTGAKQTASVQPAFEEVTPGSVRNMSKTEGNKEPKIIVQCSGHAGNSDAVAAALRESTEICRLLREDLYARRTKRNRSGRFRGVLEWLFLILVVVFVTLVVVERRMDRFTFSEVRV